MQKNTIGQHPAMAPAPKHTRETLLILQERTPSRKRARPAHSTGTSTRTQPLSGEKVLIGETTVFLVVSLRKCCFKKKLRFSSNPPLSSIRTLTTVAKVQIFVPLERNFAPFECYFVPFREGHMPLEDLFCHHWRNI